MDITALNNFFSQYRTISAKHNPTEEEKVSHFTSFFSGVSNVLKQTQKYEIENAPGFNIFNIIRMQYYEALTHTPFLSNLFDPLGSHSQGFLFYNAFIDHLPLKRKSQFRASRLHVSPEHWTNDGYIDIFIRSLDVDNPFCIILENKIDAPDQPLQLIRYYNYALQLGYTDDNIVLLYLTKPGSLPSSTSLDENTQKKLAQIDCFHPISYKVFMVKLLSDVLPKVQALSVRHTINQYLQLISTF